MTLKQQILERITRGGGVSKDSLLMQHCRPSSNTQYLEHRKDVLGILKQLRQEKKIGFSAGCSYFYPLEVSNG
jgi:hypothetical protein